MSQLDPPKEAHDEGKGLPVFDNHNHRLTLCNPRNTGKQIMTLSISVFLGVVAILLAVALYREMTNQLHNLDERVKKLEQANPKRINYQSLEEIENAMAELVVLEMEHDLRAERITSIKSHLAKAHTPPKK